MLLFLLRSKHCRGAGCSIRTAAPTKPQPSATHPHQPYHPITIFQVFKLGAINGALALVLWTVLGMPVWKLLGWY